MNRIIYSLSLVLSILVFGVNTETVYANSNYKPKSFEEIYREIGYKTVEEAIKDFEQHFKQNLKLPLRVPPIDFTHHFGRFTDLEGDVNDSFEVIFINDTSPQNHYKIEVRAIKNKISIRDKYVTAIYRLKNESEAVYINISGFNVLVFEKGNWQYMLGVDKRISDKAPPETLVQIANSLDYSNK
ncbi:hypothetical protein [Pseudobacillus badius]|uniref:hypothetical protein n=1 Tax=Bacillus badius TaxID=1455 RepID=UPI0007B3B418|nr:hypothetical protein [Bacillus badius]KZR59356.1 hypothetical protein A3781_13220 [Bacillus badius]